MRLTAALVLSACSLQYPRPPDRCIPGDPEDALCPDGQTCIDGRCVDAATDGGSDGGPDGGAGDGGLPELCVKPERPGGACEILPELWHGSFNCGRKDQGGVVSRAGSWRVAQVDCSVGFALIEAPEVRVTGVLENGGVALEGAIGGDSTLGPPGARCCGAVKDGRVLVHCEGGCRLDLGAGGRADGQWPWPVSGCGRSVPDTSGGTGWGASCTSHGECPGNVCSDAWPNRYCTAGCSAGCPPDEAVCSTEQGNNCLRRCEVQSDCMREGYACVPSGPFGEGGCQPDCRVFPLHCTPALCNCLLGSCQPAGVLEFGARCHPQTDACAPTDAACVVMNAQAPDRGFCTRLCASDEDCDFVGGAPGQCTVHRPEGDLCGWRCALSGESCPAGWTCDLASGFCLP
jgi:hypothetical protein